MNLPKVGVEAVIEGMARFQADGRLVNKTFTDMGKGASGLGSIISSLTPQLTSLLSTLAKIGTVGAGVALAGIGAGLYTVASAGLSANNSMEQARGRINAFTKDAGETERILQDVRKEAALTPFEFDEMASSVAGLLPAAKQADVGVMDLLRDAEILAASNPAEGIEGGAFALKEAVSGDFTSVIERFNLPRQFINDLKEEGVPNIEIVRRAMQEMGLDFDLVTAMANTASGRWSTLKDTFTNLAATVTQPIFDTFSSSLGDINAWLAANEPMLTNLATLLAGQVSAAITNVVSGIQKVSGAFQRFGVHGAAVSLLGQLGFSPEEVARITPTVDAIIAAVNQVFSAFETFGARGAAFSIMGLLGISSDTMVTINTVITGIITTLSGFATQVMTILSGITFTEITALFNQFMTLWNTNWPIIQATALTAWGVIQGIFAGFQTALGPVLTQLSTQFTQVFGQISQIVSSFGISWSDVWNALLTATGIVAAGIGAAIVGIIGVVAGLATGIAEGISAAITMFQNLASNVAGIFTGLTTIVVGWIETFKALLAGDFAGAWEGFKIVLDGAVTFWSNMWGGMITVATGSADIIASTLVGFVEGIVGFFQGLYDQLVGHSIIPDLINDIVSWFKKLPQMALSALGSLATTLVGPFEDARQAIEEAWRPDRWIEIGTAVIDGIISGLKKSQAKVLEFFKSVIGDWITGVQSQFGIQSPSTVFAGIGTNLMEGLAGGINASAGLAQSALDTLFSGMTVQSAAFQHQFIDDLNIGGFLTDAGALGGGQRRNFRNIVQNAIRGNMGLLESGNTAGIFDLLNREAARFNFPPSLVREFTQMNGLVQHLQGTFNNMFSVLRVQNLKGAAQVAGQFVSAAGGFVDILSAGMEKRQETIDQFKEFLDSGEQRFRIFRESEGGGTSEFFIDRNRAQREYNQLLEQQRREQEQINRLEQDQQKLGFLQQQIGLLDLIRSRGLNPADILGGIRLGLEANVSDLLAATSNVVSAMVEQINQDLQIASPSRVMAKIGQQMMAGLQGGIASMTPVLNAQLSASVAGPISPMMAGALGGSAGDTYHITNQFGGNTINTPMDEAAFAAKVIQIIRRELY